MMSSARLIGAVLLLAAAYFVTGKLGLLLAIPPGYATAVWPPSGIALGALLLFGPRLWPGVLLGSFLTNIGTSLDTSSTQALFGSVAVAALIGLAASAQALIGVGLTRRFANFPGPLTNERDIFAFFALGGPVACLTNATLAVSTLFATGAIDASAVAQSWWTWWVGDSIGVLIFCPLTIMWLGPAEQWRQRRVAVTVPLATMFLAAVLLFVHASRSYQSELASKFREDATKAATAVERRLDMNAELLRAASSIFIASSEVTEQEYRRFLQLLLPGHPELAAVTWAPRITHAERSALEASLRSQVADHPGIFERAGGRLAPSPRRDQYFPIVLAQPREPGRLIEGFDLYSEPKRRAAMAQACASAQVTATEPLTLASQQPGFLMFMPVYATDSSEVQSDPARCANVRGYIIGIIDIEKMLARESQDPLVGSMQLTITDTAAKVLLYARGRAEDSVEDLHIRASIPIFVGGRQWSLAFEPTASYVLEDRGSTVWLVLAGGLVLSALVGAGALILTGRNAEIGALVQSRTEELARSNEQLAKEVEEHVATEKTLAHERNFFKTLIENLGDGIVIFDENGETVMLNRAARETQVRMSGTSERAANWREYYTLCYPDGKTPIPKEQLPRYRALRGETVRNVEMIALAPNRPPVVLLVTAQPITDPSGMRAGGVDVVRDITEERKADLLKREFVSVVSHELRTPLTSIFGSLSLVRGGAAGAVSEKAAKLIEIAFRNAERLTLLINDILDIEKIESGELRLRLKSQPLQPLVQQALDANAGYAQGCEVKLVLTRPVPDVHVNVDENRLLQVLANLLSNASKFSKPGSAVEITAAVRDAAVRISVEDHGPGIAPEFEARIFRKFSQADGSDTRAKAGTGLGLAISRALIERMSGKIGYTTQLGVGSVFYIELPLAQREVTSYSPDPRDPSCVTAPAT